MNEFDETKHISKKYKTKDISNIYFSDNPLNRELEEKAAKLYTQFIEFGTIFSNGSIKDVLQGRVEPLVDIKRITFMYCIVNLIGYIIELNNWEEGSDTSISLDDIDKDVATLSKLIENSD